MTFGPAESETLRRERDEQGEDRDQQRFGELMLYKTKHLHERKAQRQMLKHITRKVQGRELCGPRNFECNTDLIETKKLENYTCQIAQDLYKGEAHNEPRGAQHCRSLHKCLDGLGAQSFARERKLRILDGTKGDD